MTADLRSMLHGVILACTVILFCTACSRSSSAGRTESPRYFTYTSSISPTPVDHATSRYSDFVYHYRKKGTADFVDVSSSSVKPTDDGSVLAKFIVSIPSPPVDQVYEQKITYRLDGNLQDGSAASFVPVAKH